MTETTTAQTMAVLAELVLTANRLNLPTPLYLTASEKNSQLNLTLNNRADLEAWHQVFGGGRLWECAPTASSPSVLVTNMHSGSMLGWSVNLQANVPPPLSAEVLAALGEAARSDAEAVAESLAAPAPVKELPAKPREWRDRCGDVWQERPDGLIALVIEDGLSSLFVYGDVADLEHEFGPLVEVAQ